MDSRKEMLEKLRKKMQERGSNRDPDQFFPPRTKEKEEIEMYFWVLPPLEKGETCKSGVAPNTADMWYYPNGAHLVLNERLECPRLHDNEECPLCQLGFDLMQDSNDSKVRSAIAKKYLPKSGFATNVYFLNNEKNPERVRGKVMWFNLPKTVCDIMEGVIVNEDPGDQQDPKAYGVFYHPTEGGYTFKLKITKQGEYNDYKSSQFLPASYGPLFRNKDGTTNVAAIQKVLDQRIWLPQKFNPRIVEKLQSIVDKILESDKSGSVGKDNVPDASSVSANAPANAPANVPGVVKGGAAKLPPKVQESVIEMPVSEGTKPKISQSLVAQLKTPSKSPVKAPKSPPDDPDEVEIERLVSEINSSEE